MILKIKYNKGVSLVEIVVAAAIIMVSVVSIFATHAIMVKFSLSNTEYIQGALLAEEGVEAIKTLRDYSFSSEITPLFIDTPYYLEWDGSRWVTTTDTIITDNVFERFFYVDDVFRDVTTDDIVPPGGISSVFDPSTKKITMSVSWLEKGATTTKTIETYIHDTFNN